MKIGFYTKSELARLYFPDSDADAARKRLMRHIRKCRELHAKLVTLGMATHQRLFTPAMVREIVYYLGEP